MLYPDLSGLNISAPAQTLFDYLAEKGAGHDEGCDVHRTRAQNIDLDKTIPQKPKKPSAPRPPKRGGSDADAQKYKEKRAEYLKKVDDYQEELLRYTVKKDSYDSELARDCAINGYFMYKPLPNDLLYPEKAKCHNPGNPTENLGHSVKVAGKDGVQVEFKSMGERLEAWNKKSSRFENNNKAFMDKAWANVCGDREDGGKGRVIKTYVDENGVEQPKDPRISWRWPDRTWAYGADIGELSDWSLVYVDDAPGNSDKDVGDETKQQGLMFVSLVDDDFKEKWKYPMHGNYSKDYLYVVVVCGYGVGGKMVSMVEEMAKAIGCAGVALSTLPEPAPFYYYMGYRFMHRNTGTEIDVRAWEREDTRNGKTRTVLKPDELVSVAPKRKAGRDANEDSPGDDSSFAGRQTRSRTRQRTSQTEPNMPVSLMWKN